jgi:branched-subunit amino acid transport protein AzlD
VRPVVTSALAFFLSLLAGGVVAQQLAVSTGAQEEYILVFIAAVLVAVAVTIPFFIAQYRREPLGAIGIVGKWLTVIFIVLVVVLAAWSYVAANGDPAKYSKDIPIIAGLVLPGLVITMVQWLFTRWRVRRAVPQFGRGAS